MGSLSERLTGLSNQRPDADMLVGGEAGAAVNVPEHDPVEGGFVEGIEFRTYLLLMLCSTCHLYTESCSFFRIENAR